jgi:DNA polymerase-3 subunit gamma/tau
VTHAYLFSGPRGTGKTSTARILAMALNCEATVDGEPDGTCPSCLAVRSGASMDVFELDAASNRKLDEMRDLLSRVALGTPGRWKVYIVDEVHQLTADAASALLKTLEEPPPHVVFVLATTDPQKVLPTILSRTQHFEFHLLDGEVLTGLLADINRDAGLGLSDGALRVAVQKGRGSARDAESALEQLAAIGTEQDDAAPVVELMKALAGSDVAGVLEAVARAVAAGRDPRRLGSDLIEHLRNGFLAVQAPSLVLLPAAETAQLAEEARKMSLPLLVRAMETVGQALVEMRDAVEPRVTLEVALVRLASPAADESPGALLERLERLERAFAERSGETVAQVPVPPRAGAAGHLGRESSPPPPAHGGEPSVPDQLGGEGQPLPTGPVSPAPPQTRVALGAFLKGTGEAPGAKRDSEVTGAAGAPGPTAPPLRPGVAAPAGAGVPARPANPATSAAPAVPASGAPAGPPPTSEPRLPTRDELTKAWGDTVLAQLQRPAQVYLGNGHFTEVGDAAVLALPGAGLLARAERFTAEAEAALERHFGRKVPLRLVVDTPAPPAGTAPVPPPPEGEEDAYDLAELADAPPEPAVTAEQLILGAFPGAVVEG